MPVNWRGRPARRLSRVCLAAWAGLIVVASLIPRVPGPIGTISFPGSDKLLHVFAYGVLCMLMVWAGGGGGLFARTVGPGLAAVMFGLLVESAQRFTGRAFGWVDLMANCVGVVCGLVAVALAARWVGRRAARTMQRRSNQEGPS